MRVAEQFVADARAALRLADVWQYELADRLNVTPKHLNQLLKGKVRMTLDHAEAIADALGFDLDVRFVLRHAAEQDERVDDAATIPAYESGCPDCLCCTRADCAGRSCGACPCTEG